MQQRFSVLAIVLSLLYVGLGIVMFGALPIFNDIYSGMYSDWQFPQNLFLSIYNLPSSIWLWTGFGLALFILLLNAVSHSLVLNKYFNKGMLIVWVIFLIHAVDVLYGFMFCHQWGCNQVLPTWRWLGLTG